MQNETEKPPKTLMLSESVRTRVDLRSALEGTGMKRRLIFWLQVPGCPHHPEDAAKDRNQLSRSLSGAAEQNWEDEQHHKACTTPGSSA